MALSLLNVLNATLKRVSIIEGSSGELSSLTDSARQTDIDVMIDVINEVLDDLYSLSEALEREVAESSFTLVTDTREYDLASDFVRMLGRPIDRENNRRLNPYPGGYLQMIDDQPDASEWTGVPITWTVNPVNGKLRVGNTPTSTENGDVYNYAYEVAINLSTAAATFGFSDEVVQNLYPAITQAWSRERNASFDADAYQRSLARAAAKLRNTPTPTSYGVLGIRG